MTFYRGAPCGYVVMKAMANQTSAKFICPAALGCGLDVEQGPTLPFPSFKGPGHKASLFEYTTGDETFTHTHTEFTKNLKAQRGPQKHRLPETGSELRAWGRHAGFS